jgi:hypothetical protein
MLHDRQRLALSSTGSRERDLLTSGGCTASNLATSPVHSSPDAWVARCALDAFLLN